MKKPLKKRLKILKWIGIVLLGIIIILLIVRFIGKMYYNRTPQGGINESMYIDVNGQQQWLSIYGEDRNNPVLLNLHGGPGDSSSLFDYRILRSDLDAAADYVPDHTGKNRLVWLCTAFQLLQPGRHHRAGAVHPDMGSAEKCISHGHRGRSDIRCLSIFLRESMMIITSARS